MQVSNISPVSTKLERLFHSLASRQLWQWRFGDTVHAFISSRLGGRIYLYAASDWPPQRFKITSFQHSTNRTLVSLSTIIHLLPAIPFATLRSNHHASRTRGRLPVYVLQFSRRANLSTLIMDHCCIVTDSNSLPHLGSHPCQPADIQSSHGSLLEVESGEQGAHSTAAIVAEGTHGTERRCDSEF